jgi:ribonuclease H2 subunit C
VVPLSTKDSACLDVDEEDDGGDENLAETKIVEEIAAFDEVMIWGHEASVDVTEDPYTKGMEEWISLAEAVSPSSLSA